MTQDTILDGVQLSWERLGMDHLSFKGMSTTQDRGKNDLGLSFESALKGLVIELEAVRYVRPGNELGMTQF